MCLMRECEGLGHATEWTGSLDAAFSIQRLFQYLGPMGEFCDISSYVIFMPLTVHRAAETHFLADTLPRRVCIILHRELLCRCSLRLAFSFWSASTNHSYSRLLVLSSMLPTFIPWPPESSILGFHTSILWSHVCVADGGCPEATQVRRVSQARAAWVEPLPMSRAMG